MLSHSVMSNSLQPKDCSLQGSSVHGVFQARILDWVAIFKPTSKKKKKKTVTFRGLWGINSLFRKVVSKGKESSTFT